MHTFSSMKRSSFVSVGEISINEWLTYYNVRMNKGETMPIYQFQSLSLHNPSSIKVLVMKLAIFPYSRLR